MKHYYPYQILSLLLTAAFFLGGCAQDPQHPAVTESDTEFLYQSEFSYLDQNGFSYTFADIGIQYPVMLATDETFTYGIAEPIQACMWCNIYYLKEGEVCRLGSLNSLGTAYPIAFDETGLYEAGPKGVRKWTIQTESGTPELVIVQDAYISYDENGTPFYSCEKNGENLEISKDVYQRLFDDYQAAAVVFFEEAPARSISDEALALMQSLENASGHKMEEYICVDMDHDGKEEMMGTYEEDSLNWPVWYASSDGNTCQTIPGLLQGYDTCTFKPLSFPAETHIVVNMANLMGNNKRYSIYRLKGQEIQPIVENQYGFVYQNATGDILLDVEDYDACYDVASELFMGHTWKDTYLYYEDGCYKEYGAIPLSEAQFLQYENAAKILSDIRNESGSDEILFSYFLRENGIVHIQCECTTEYGSIDYFYYTLRAEGNRLTGSIDSKNDGRMGTSFSWLEVTYPKELPGGSS